MHLPSLKHFLVFTLTVDTHLHSEPVKCGAASYSVGGVVTECTECPAGKKCPDTGTVNPITCGKCKLGL